LSRRLRRTIVTVCAATVVIVHAPPLVFGRYVNVDEAYASALAERLLEGFRLYEGAVSQRGPLMYRLYELFAAIWGWDNVRGLRVTALSFALGQLWLVWLLGKRFLGYGVAAAAVLICAYAITLGMYPFDGMALNGEVLQVPFVLAALLLGCEAGSAGSRKKLALAGLLFGCAIVIKQSAALLPLPLLLWRLVGRRPSRPGVLVDVSVYVAAVSLPAIAFLVQAAADGTLSSLWYYCVTFNLKVHGAGPGRFADWFNPLYEHLRTQTAYFFLVAVTVAVAGGRAWRRARLAVRTRRLGMLFAGFGAEDCIAATGLAALATAASIPQHFGHYYVLATPMLALTAASAARHALESASGRRRGPGLVLAAATALFGLYGVVFAYQTADDKGCLTHDKLVLAAASYVERTTSVFDKVFVWGFSPWIYEYAHRRPAGRFLFETYVTGFLPLYWSDLANEPARVVPGSLAALIGDLERERPAVVADAGSLMIARSMRAYPLAADWLRAHYCFEARVGAVDLYRRRGDGEDCSTPYYPCPHPPMTHWGQPLYVPVPPIVDARMSGFLGPGPADEPKGFAPDEKPQPCPVP
jgi:hypothetical protein